MRRQAFILFILCQFCGAYSISAQMNGVGDLSHPTVDELHLKLNELVGRFKADETEKRKNAEKAKVKGDKPSDSPTDEFRIVLERGGRRTALDRDNPVILEEIVMKLSGNTIISVELKYEEAALRRQFSHRRSIKNDDVKKTSYGHITTFYQAEGDVPVSEVLVNMSSVDRAKLLAIYIDGLMRAIRDLDDRVLAAKKFSGKKMNSALNMGVRIK